jgi:hypothetical protein
LTHRVRRRAAAHRMRLSRRESRLSIRTRQICWRQTEHRRHRIRLQPQRGFPSLQEARTRSCWQSERSTHSGTHDTLEVARRGRQGRRGRDSRFDYAVGKACGPADLLDRHSRRRQLAARRRVAAGGGLTLP